MRTNPQLNLMQKTDLDKITGMNSLVKDGILSPTYYKIAKSVTESSNKVQKP